MATDTGCSAVQPSTADVAGSVSSAEIITAEASFINTQPSTKDASTDATNCTRGFSACTACPPPFNNAADPVNWHTSRSYNSFTLIPNETSMSKDRQGFGADTVCHLPTSRSQGTPTIPITVASFDNFHQPGHSISIASATPNNHHKHFNLGVPMAHKSLIGGQEATAGEAIPCSFVGNAVDAQANTNQYALGNMPGDEFACPTQAAPDSVFKLSDTPADTNYEASFSCFQRSWESTALQLDHATSFVKISRETYRSLGPAGTAYYKERFLLATGMVGEFFDDRSNPARVYLGVPEDLQAKLGVVIEFIDKRLIRCLVPSQSPMILQGQGQAQASRPHSG
ncbi:hypothetical protein F5Y18DRAFT_124212 [Xylariaceae sp. FL1019]|nr:hypothetical protein F5Y18DRAFT_124212 [Xylariaceae sp. FL1019]